MKINGKVKNNRINESVKSNLNFSKIKTLLFITPLKIGEIYRQQ
jgi:hypothetical protein